MTIANKILSWYDIHARILPWRIPPIDSKKGVLPDPYFIWISEIMLQQTNVTTVKPYYDKFLTLWPTIEALADAPDQMVMTAWAGLGYYARARNLHKCAKIVSNDYRGVFPSDFDVLKTLPGIGDYTAAAISSIAFRKSVAVMDGNIERITARLYAVDTPLKQAKPVLYQNIQKITPALRAGDFAQAMMDIGATICTPKNPSCLICPVRDDCAAYKQKNMEFYPVKNKKRPVPKRRGVCLVIIDFDGNILIEKRPRKGLFGGMYVLPFIDSLPVEELTTKICGKAVNMAVDKISIYTKNDLDIKANGKDLSSNIIFDNIVDKFVNKANHNRRNKHDSALQVKHIFTHFHLDLDVVFFKLENPQLAPNQRWISMDEHSLYPFPSLMQKVFGHIIKMQRKNIDFMAKAS